MDGDAIPEKKIDRRSVDLDEEEKKMEGEKPEARKRRSPQVSAPVPTGRRRRSPQSMPGMDQAMSMASSFGGRKRRSPQEEKGELESEQEAKEVEQQSGENNNNNNNDDDDNTENENKNSDSHDSSSEEEGDKKRDRRSPQDQVKQVTGRKRRSANDENHSGDHQEHKHD